MDYYTMMNTLHTLLDRFADEKMHSMLEIETYWEFLRTRDKLYHLMWEAIDNDLCDDIDNDL